MVADQAAWGGIGATVVADAAAGDAVAFARIVAAHHEDMVRVCFVICGDRELARDAVQAAWPIAWRKLRSLRDPDRLRPWLVTIAAREARHLLRQERRHRTISLDVASGMPTGWDTRVEDETADLGTALSGLRPDEREILALRYVVGLDATEIGQALGLSSSGVRSRLARAIQRLREDLSHD